MKRLVFVAGLMAVAFVTMSCGTTQPPNQMGSYTPRPPPPPPGPGGVVAPTP